MIASALDEINKLKTSGPPLANVDKFKAEDQRIKETDLKSNTWWLDYLVTGLQNQDDLHELNTYNSDLSKVTQASLKIMAEKYLSGENYIKLVLMPDHKN